MTRRLTAVAIAVLGATLAAPAIAAAPAEVTRNGVGKVKLGATHKSLQAKNLVGPKVPGCELAGPRERAAVLKGPVEGAVELTRGKTRRVRTILVTKGAAAKGVGIGDTAKEVRKRFPDAEFDSSTEEVFRLTLVTVPRSDGGRFQFGLGARNNKVQLIGVPFIAFCE